MAVMSSSTWGQAMAKLPGEQICFLFLEPASDKILCLPFLNFSKKGHVLILDMVEPPYGSLQKLQASVANLPALA